MEHTIQVSLVTDEKGAYIVEEGKILTLTESGSYEFIQLSESIREACKIPQYSVNDEKGLDRSQGEKEDATTSSCDDTNKLWSHQSTLLLINLVNRHQEDFEKQIKKHVWEKIAKAMSVECQKPFTRIQVDTKWKGLVATYKNVKDNNNTSGKARKHWKYYALMNDILFNKPEINPVATCSSYKGLVQRETLGDEAANDTNLPKDKKEKFESSFAQKRTKRD